MPFKLQGKIKDEEWWYVKCVDKYTKYHKNLTKAEESVLCDIVEEISNIKNGERVIILYYNGIEILHNAFCRKYPNNECALRTTLSDKEEIEHPSALAVTEVYECKKGVWY